MATVQYTCDACDAQFEVDTNAIPEEGLFCPECGETEILRVAGVSMGDCSCSCESPTSDSPAGVKRRG